MSDDPREPRQTAPWPPAPPAASLEVGATLGRYQLLERLGQGGMGVVFAAHDPELDRTVAVKVLHPELGGPGSEGEKRLRREGQTMARLTHPNVIRVYDVGVEGGVAFVAMEHVAGGTLQRWLDAAPRRLDEILRVFAQAGEGLAAAHDAGLVHRDFKPSNVLVSDDGRVLVTDFGVARSQLAGAPGEDARPRADQAAGSITGTGGLVGTPAYMAPEQHLRGPVDARADQFSFCVALWSALYGKAPYAGETFEALAESTTRGALVEPPAGSRVPAHVRAALTRGLRPEPAARFPSMRALLHALADDPALKRRRRLRALALAALALAAALGTGLGALRLRGDPCAPLGDRFAGVWDAEARRQVHAAFAATGMPYAETSFAEVARQLDARRAAWEAMRRSSCEATRVHKVQSDSMLDARAACLERSAGELQAFVAVLRRADAAAVRGAAEGAARVGDPSPCGDVLALSRRAPLPDDPARRKDISAIERALQPVRAQVSAGHGRDAHAEATRLVERARAAAYDPLTADALVLAAQAQRAADRPAEAERLLEEAVLAAEAGGDDALRFDAELELVMVVGYLLERDAEGQRHGERARALLHRLGDDARREARLARATAIAAWWNGRFGAAQTDAERAVALLEQSDPTGAELARALHALSIVHQDLHNDEAAIRVATRALAVSEAALGKEHPTTAQILQTASGAYRRLARYDEARRALTRSLAIVEATSPAASTEVAYAVHNLGVLYLSEGRFDDAVRELQRSADLLKKVLGPDHTRHADMLQNLGSALSKAGRRKEAEATLERAIAIHHAKFGDRNPATAASLRHLGEHYLRSGEPARAVAQLERAVQVLEGSQGGKSPLLAGPLAGLGAANARLGRTERARAAYERALSLVGTDASQAARRAEIELGLAKLIVGTDRARALELAERARERYAGLGPTKAAERSDVEAWLRAH